MFQDFATARSRSSSTGKSTGIASKKRFTRGSTSATEMAITDSVGCRRASRNRFSAGNSSRQGSHQVAKKCTRTVRPLNVFKGTFLPFRSCREKSGLRGFAARCNSARTGGRMQRTQQNANAIASSTNLQRTRHVGRIVRPETREPIDQRHSRIIGMRHAAASTQIRCDRRWRFERSPLTRWPRTPHRGACPGYRSEWLQCCSAADICTASEKRQGAR